MILVGLVSLFLPVMAQTFSTTYNFEASASNKPLGELTRGSDGNFYGTTSQGGSSDCGTFFKVTPAGILTKLGDFNRTAGICNPVGKLVLALDGYFYGVTSYSFSSVFKVSPTSAITLVASLGFGGQYPQAGLIQGSDGNFYGTAYSGGTSSSATGSVFKVTPTGTVITLVVFSPANNGGYYPRAPLVQSSDGNYYGTTTAGGSGGKGTVFKMTSTGTLTTLVNFTGANGAAPYAGLMQASDGSLYGTTSAGGAFTTCTDGCGTVFKMTPSVILTTLYSFNSALGEGYNPRAGLTQGSDGEFYGTTDSGGSSNCGVSGCGTTFKITPSGTLTTLVNFAGYPTNGSVPAAGVVQGSDGSFYGTTSTGGGSGLGTIYKVTSAGTFTNLSDFPDYGNIPYVEFVPGPDGNLYGGTSRVTDSSNGGCGTLLKVTPGGVPTKLVNLDFTSTGCTPSRLVLATDGNFYGTTSKVVFKLSPSGTFTAVASFPSSVQLSSSLIQASDGNFYGTSYYGGNSSSCLYTPSGCGTVFKVTPSGTFTILVNFADTNSTGYNPYAPLVQGSDGNFYGTTVSGGSGGKGTVFTMTPTGIITTLVNFNGANGAGPQFGGLILASDGNFYGTTPFGGTGSSGTVYKMTPDGALTTLVNFSYTNGATPYAGLTQGSDGNFYGTTYSGGTSGYGTVFKMTPTGTLTTLVGFNYTNGSRPHAGLVLGLDSKLYGTTSGGGTATGGTLYSLTLPVSLTSFSPTSGPVGTSVTVTGTSFTGTTSVKFNGASANFTVNSPTQITATVPTGATTGAITVDTPNGIATSLTSFTVIPVPTITSFTPTSGLVGTSVVITGTGFNGATDVQFNGLSAAYNVNSATQITATVPTGATTGAIVVTTASGTATSTTSFTVPTAPTISSFTPASGPIGTTVVVTGTSFTGATAVKFNGISATNFAVNSATQITAMVPAGATTGLITVTTPLGIGTSAEAFTITGDAPAITSLTPNSGSVGSLVIINGSKLTGTTSVKFGATSASYVVNADTQITALVPLGASTGPVTVATPNGTASSTATFTLTTGAPTISSLSPSSGPVGTLVILNGNKFNGTLGVKFNKTSAPFVVNSNTQITTVVPRGATTGKVSVSTPSGTVSSAGIFTVAP